MLGSQLHKADFDKLAEEGWVSARRHPDLPLTIYCYTPVTQYDRHWDDLTKLARGIVFDDDGNLIARPFPKFFGYGDPMAPEIPSNASQVFVTEKMDGSLILVSNYQDTALVTTKGSFFGSQPVLQAERARKFLGSFVPPPGWTYIFEYIAPDNRIVVNYGDYEGIVFLGTVHHQSGVDGFPPDLIKPTSLPDVDCRVATRFHYTVNEILEMVSDPVGGWNQEGYVVAWDLFDKPAVRLKFKYVQYVKLHAVLTNLTDRGIWEALKEDRFAELLEYIPDELYQVVHDVADELKTRHSMIFHAAHEVAMRAKTLPDRKSQALYIKDSLCNPSVAFKLLDDQDPTQHIWDLIYPTPSKKLFFGAE